MNKKKEGSLSARNMKLRSEKSLSREHYQYQHKLKYPQISLAVKKTNQFIEYYHMVKQQHSFNLSSSNIFQEIKQCQTHDEEFFFDVDLGVPYAESQHLDSGFEYDENTNEPSNFPKVSSAKQIFTSVLDISQSQSNQLDDENFTDQQDNSQKQLGQSSISSSKFQKRSRKEVPPILQNAQQVLSSYSMCQQMHNESFLLQNSRNQDEDDQFIMMQKLKATVQNRQKKLKFWNHKLVELNKSSNLSTANSKVTPYLNQENSLSRLNSNSTVSIHQHKVDNPQPMKSPTKRSKFQKEPASKQPRISLKVDGRQNLSPLDKKTEVKRILVQPKVDVSRMETMTNKIKTNKENDENYVGSRVINKNLSDRRQQILQRKNPKSRSRQIKEKSLTRRVL